MNNIFRRMNWSADGLLFLVPQGERMIDGQMVYCSYMFLRKNLEEPFFSIMFDEPVNVAVFSPKVYKVKKGEKSLF